MEIKLVEKDVFDSLSKKDNIGYLGKTFTLIDEFNPENIFPHNKKYMIFFFIKFNNFIMDILRILYIFK